MSNTELSASNTPPTAKRSKFTRSRVGNGRDLLPMTDHRPFQDLFEDICADLGGADAAPMAPSQ
jgi:hypothetical protein